MSQTLKSLGIDQLSVAQRILLVEEIWDSIATEAERYRLMRCAKGMTWSRRLANHADNPRPDLAGKRSRLTFRDSHELALLITAGCQVRPC